MKLTKSIIAVVSGLLMMTACSKSDPIDNGNKSEYGFTRSPHNQDIIPVNLINLSELPQWLREKTEGWTEKDRKLAGYKIYRGKYNCEMIYYIDNLLSSWIGFYCADGSIFMDGDWNSVTDWECIYSELPFIQALTGILHFDPNTETWDHYVESDNKRYYIWGWLSTDELSKYNGKFVQLGGFSWGDITNVKTDCPSGITCYGIDATYIRMGVQ